MDLLIEQMLDTARLEHDRLELSRDRFDVRWVAQEQLDVFRPLGRNHHFVMDAAREPLLVEGDRSRIATIVANFMDNALSTRRRAARSASCQGAAGLMCS
jgi:K+-sensing histidine kinase KdpD